MPNFLQDLLGNSNILSIISNQSDSPYAFKMNNSDYMLNPLQIQQKYGDFSPQGGHILDYVESNTQNQQTTPQVVQSIQQSPQQNSDYINPKILQYSSLANGIGNALQITTDALGTSLQTSNNPRTRATGLILNTVGSKVATNVGKGIASQFTKEGLKSLSATFAKGGLSATTKQAGMMVGKGFSSGLKSLFTPMSVGTMAADIGTALIGDKSEYSGDKGGITKGLDTAYDVIETGMAAVPVFGQVVSLGMAANKLLNTGMNKWTGSGTDGMTTADAILGSNFLGPLGWANGWGGQRAMKLNNNNWLYNNQVNSILNNYGSVQKTLQDANKYQGKKFGLVSNSARHKADKAIQAANDYRNKAFRMYNQNQIDFTRGYDMNGINNLQYLNDINGNNRLLSYGKLGMKLEKAKQIVFKSKQIKSKQSESKQIPVNKEGGILDNFNPKSADWKPTINKDIFKFQNGGSMNVIPEGALHARKNNMDVEHITKKGIPVVDNDGHQQAEIEKNEIIFRKEVTDKIEQYAKDGSDEAAIKCGKLLAKEIVENTDDRTGLTSEIIQKAQKGGTLKPFIQKGFNKDSIKSYNDLIKYMESTGRQTTDDYDLEKAYNDSNVYNSWIDEETKNPGKGHWPDKYKKPNHMTFSDESIYSNDDQLGGQWLFKNNKDVFVISPYLAKLHSYDDYVNYFKNNEPNAAFIYNGKSYNLK